VQAGVVQPVLSPTPLDDVVAAAIRSLGTRRELVDTLVPETLLPVRADPALLERAVANVVANALAYTPDGQRVRVEATELGRRVQLRVVDRGPGIPEQDRQRVFQPFQRLGDSAPGGVGLGLAVAHGFLGAMGAMIDIEETPGGGATVMISLPVA
jgi:two-component system sensor histidine kinase KdpD